MPVMEMKEVKAVKQWKERLRLIENSLPFKGRARVGMGSKQFGERLPPSPS
jgi:hypothetical protein